MWSVIERWLNLGGAEAETFLVGSNLMWSVWKSRCKWVFERTPFFVDSIKVMAASISQCMQGVRRPASETAMHGSIHPAWTVPPLYELKVKVHASIGQAYASAAAVCRDAAGQLLQVEAERIHSTYPELADASWLGLYLAVNRVRAICTTASDAQCLVEWINRRDRAPPWRTAHIVMSVRILSTTMWA